jgi:kumamolisin
VITAALLTPTTFQLLSQIRKVAEVTVGEMEVGAEAGINRLLIIRFLTVRRAAALQAVYNLNSNGGNGVIAIVEAFDYPTALADFNVFATQYGLPTETSATSTSSTNKVFQVVYASGQPRGNAGWNQEAAMDIEWAHAMAPNAKIVLVEARSSSTQDLFAAVQVASQIPNVKVVSMSWGQSEFANETQYDSYFTTPGVIYVASSGDVGGTLNYPGCSPNVIAAGGTTIVRDATGKFTSEQGWTSTGGGVSQYESIPAYQSAIAAKVGSHRGVPDISFNANPTSGASIYCSTPYQGYQGWVALGGTSLAAPCIAGIINSASSGAVNTQAELTLIYNNLGTSNYRDITTEFGPVGYYPNTVGWDFVTGVGSPFGTLGK